MKSRNENSPSRFQRSSKNNLHNCSPSETRVEAAREDLCQWKQAMEKEQKCYIKKNPGKRKINVFPEYTHSQAFSHEHSSIYPLQQNSTRVPAAATTSKTWPETRRACFSACDLLFVCFIIGSYSREKRNWRVRLLGVGAIGTIDRKTTLSFEVEKRNKSQKS